MPLIYQVCQASLWPKPDINPALATMLRAIRPCCARKRAAPPDLTEQAIAKAQTAVEELNDLLATIHRCKYPRLRIAVEPHQDLPMRPSPTDGFETPCFCPACRKIMKLVHQA